MRRRSSYGCLGLLLVAALVVSCGGIGQTTNGNKTTTSSTTTVPGLSFDISKAKAIAGNSSSVTAQIEKEIGRKLTRSASSLAALVKLQEDGTLSSAIKFASGSSWTPDISFISVGDDKSVYICFSSMYQTWNNDGTSSSVQLVRVHPDNTYDVIWPPDPASYNYSTTGQVYTWSWVGMDTDPLQKGADGQLYFKVESYSGSTTNDAIYSYDPAAGGKAVLRTPANGTMTIQSFMVDSQKHLFIQSGNMGLTSASYMRCYSPGVTAPLNIYYDSTSSMWVRGYTTTPAGNALILNGYNIQGKSGIMRANITSPSTATYDLLYQSGMNYYNFNLVEYSLSTMPTTIIDGSITNMWDPSVMNGVNLDKTKLLAVIAPLYLGTVTISDANFQALLALNLNDNSGSYPWAPTYSGLVYSISLNPQAFLRYYFTGTLMCDFMTANSMSYFDLTNVGSMIWAKDGSLYGLYDNTWYGGSTAGTFVLKLLDNSGNTALGIVSLAHGKDKPTKIKFNGDYLYYRYAVMSGGQETGYHKLARLNIAAKTEEDLMTDPYFASRNLEVHSYDVSSDGLSVYFSALDYNTNANIFGKIDMGTKAFTSIPADTIYNTVRTF